LIEHVEGLLIIMTQQDKKGNDKEVYAFNRDGDFTIHTRKINMKKYKRKKKHDVKSELDNTRLDMIQ
ncbi:MAG: hypothetical protein LLF83_09035, partial [Methanobacterium sp.]|nr:hypothetical protein [Methanobacterium sp.]